LVSKDEKTDDLCSLAGDLKSAMGENGQEGEVSAQIKVFL